MKIKATISLLIKVAAVLVIAHALILITVGYYYPGYDETLERLLLELVR